MHRRQRSAPARVGLGTLIVGLALSLMSFGIAPAQAGAGDTGAATAPVARPAAASTPRATSTVPRWVGSPGTTTVALRGFDAANVDWQWTRGGWVVKFTRGETTKAARGVGYCAAVMSVLPPPLSGVGAACAIIWVYADAVAATGRCLSMFIPVSIMNFSLGYRSC